MHPYQQQLFLCTETIDLLLKVHHFMKTPGRTEAWFRKVHPILMKTPLELVNKNDPRVVDYVNEAWEERETRDNL